MNYFTKSWRGEVSLGKAFWVNKVCLNLLLITTYTLVVYAGTLTQNIQLIGRTTFFSTILLLVICYTLLPWQVVGLWRSSERHIDTTGKQFWARLAQLTLVIGLAQTAATFPEQSKEFKDMLSVTYKMSFDETVAKDPLYSASGKKDYSLTILNNDTLYIEGALQKGISHEVEKKLKENPGIRQVMLKSPGGMRTEGNLISQSITKRNLDTVAFDSCLSACTEVFASGKYRMIIKDTKIGFHKGGIVGIKSNHWLLSIEKKDFENTIYPFWRSKGIKETFIQDHTQTILNSEGNEMWYPTPDYLLKNKYAHEINV